jgi:DNA-binding PadR family transcriptional regulator
MARVNGTRQVVLGFLTWRPMSGYDIKKIVEQSVSNFWSESYGQGWPVECPRM